jgi:glutathionylspermidine synthase
MKLVAIPADKYSDYRYDVIFNAYKWDPQFGDRNTVAKHALFLTEDEALEIEKMAENLAAETAKIEDFLRKSPELSRLAKSLGFENKMIKAHKKTTGYAGENHVRVMRFDFHPTQNGWRVSEVNSDVPGGFAESSAWPETARKVIGGRAWKNTAEAVIGAFKAKLEPSARVAFVHCTSYADDRQVMQYLGDMFEASGFFAVFCAPDHIIFKNKRAYCILDNEERELGAIVRFFPLEWLTGLPKRCGWKGFFDTVTPSCNHPQALFAQSKRLPLIWDKAGIDLPYWKSLLPATVDPRDGLLKAKEHDFIYKPALGRVGEGITIEGVMPAKEIALIKKNAEKYNRDWIAQRMFKSLPLLTDDGEPLHVCVGAFTVDGKGAGFYARMSRSLRIDSAAMDIPVLIE